MPSTIFDNHERPLRYLRLSVTDRCNLRCHYCIPHEKADFVPRKELLSYEEMIRITQVLSSMGVNKVRVTGGEPLVRKNIMYLFEHLGKNEKIKWYLTTNGVRSYHFLKDLKKNNIQGINLSLDTVDREKFRKITRRDEFEGVMKTFEQALSEGIPLKMNVVVMKGINDNELTEIARLAKDHPVEVRFIEEMPFDGVAKKKDFMSYRDILFSLKAKYEISQLEESTNTSIRYSVPGWQGSLGIIPAYSRTFCSTCDRIRITATGKLKTCLYGSDQLNLKEVLNQSPSNEELKNLFIKVYGQRAKDGFEAEKENQFIHQSMSVIGG